jgi:hypothetical protein
MKNRGELTSPESERWTRAGDYVGAMARRRTERKKREPKLERTQPEAPRLLLSTLPFLALLGALGVLAVAIMIVAWPGSQPRSATRPIAHQEGVASKGWMQEAEKEFRGS